MNISNIKNIRMKHASGAETIALLPSRALVNWYISKDERMKQAFEKAYRDTKKTGFNGIVMVAGGEITYPTEGDDFLMLVDAYTERTYRATISVRATSYEDTCMLYIDFLHGLGEFTSVEVIRDEPE